jgi:nitroimidazol reductase NimA-like FMN-containing flavoprotein (pyridoxamine 5'-phosphate oxidase superfamily)
MLGILSPAKVEKLLSTQAIGRLGCQVDGKVYVLPINYGYDGTYLYAHSKVGLKIEIMRQNPHVCFEVDHSDEDGSWRSVLVWGEFEELKTVKAQRAGMKVYAQQMVRVIPNYKAMPSHGFVKGSKKDNDPFKSVVFRIRVDEKTGRFEQKDKL